MKKLVSLFVVAGMLFISCNNNKTSEPEVIEEEIVEEEVIQEDTQAVEEIAPAAEPTQNVKKASSKKVQTITKMNTDNAKKADVNTSNQSKASFEKSVTTDVKDTKNSKKVEIKTNNVSNAGAVKVNVNTSEEPVEVSVKTKGKAVDIK